MKRKLVTTLILFLISFISAVTIIASCAILVVSLITKSSRPAYLPALLLISTIVFIITRIKARIKILKLHKKLDKYSKTIKIITNLIEITAYGYFYSKKYKFKFDTDKIKALNSDNCEIATIPDHWDLSELSGDSKIGFDNDTVEFDSENPKFKITINQMYWNRFKSCVSEEEIAKSIEVMRSHNISVIHNILTFSLINGYINGEQRRILLDYGLTAINNISDDSFKFDKIDEKTGHEIYTFNISTT